MKHLTDQLTAAATRAADRRDLRLGMAFRSLIQAAENVLYLHTKEEVDEQPVLSELRRAAKHAKNTLNSN
jgi:hypothetical protein